MRNKIRVWFPYIGDKVRYRRSDNPVRGVNKNFLLPKILERNLESQSDLQESSSLSYLVKGPDTREKERVNPVSGKRSLVWNLYFQTRPHIHPSLKEMYKKSVRP